MWVLGVRRDMCCTVLVVTLSCLAACSSPPKKTEVTDNKASTHESVSAYLEAADKAQKLGNTDMALEQLDAAIKADPGTKAPWLKKAQIHFDARQYGLAITEAQEALQRDVSDLTAKSILAVSGLRVSAQALEQLRKANEVTGSTRSEAESVARLIREALGEPILVASPAAGLPDASPKPKPIPSKPVYRAPVPVISRASPPAAPVAHTNAINASAVNASTTTGGNGRNNPFGALQ